MVVGSRINARFLETVTKQLVAGCNVELSTIHPDMNEMGSSVRALDCYLQLELWEKPTLQELGITGNLLHRIWNLRSMLWITSHRLGAPGFLEYRF